MLYFLPGETTSGPTVLEKYDLHHLVGGPLESIGVRGAGPDGSPGMVVSTHSCAAGTLGYYPDKQEWRACPGGCWLGWAVDSPPTPRSLMREQNDVLSTYDMVLGDGNKWSIPAIRRAADGAVAPALDGSLGWDHKTQQMIVAAKRDQIRYYEAAARLFSWTVDRGVQDYTELLKDIATCMGALYRIGYPEVLGLGLCSQKNIDDIVVRLLGIDFLIEKKKTTTETPDTEPGVKD